MRTNYQLHELELDAEIQEGEHKGGKAKYVFCTEWKKARLVLITLKLLLSKKVIASFVIGIVISIGDGIHEKFCGQ